MPKSKTPRTCTASTNPWVVDLRLERFNEAPPEEEGWYVMTSWYTPAKCPDKARCSEVVQVLRLNGKLMVLVAGSSHHEPLSSFHGVSWTDRLVLP